MDVICLRVFPLLMTEDTSMWFSELPYNSIYTWDQLHKVFMARYLLVSKKLNFKDTLNNFTTLPRESVSSSYDRFIGFMRSISNHRIDDESLKEYFYRGHDDNGKVVLDTIAGVSYGKRGISEPTSKVPTRIIGAKVKETKMVGSYVPLGNREAGTSMTHIEDMMHKMMKRFDSVDENVKEIRNDLSGIGTQTNDPPMPSEVERVIEKDEDENEVTEYPKVDTKKKSEMTQKVVPMPRPPSPFPQRLLKKTEAGKYRRLIAILKQMSINVLLIEALE
ncbi:hypothetical protein R3W88_022660 [Solanum pinnatisectum]|uniref:Retrotransposon gag domain-containing protein n=1 Tax=Solanum pinnatisectum TaxID=50273 RepID=A0AAV9LZ66_9SOLN|nr:hypothetical protein R3W88_022660 [Solanum pinnatisectum]